MKQKKKKNTHEKRNRIISNLIIVFLIILLVGTSIKLGYKMGNDTTIGLFSRGDFCGYEGKWVHIKVEKEYSFSQLIQVCNHEAGHALFCELEEDCEENHDYITSEHYAKVCESYPRLCLNDEIYLDEIYLDDD